MKVEDQERIQAIWARFKTSLPGFKVRQSQRFMVAEAAKVLCAEIAGTISLIEAPTGVGKTFAYLLAATPAIERGQKIVIASSTIALQEQILTKDIPLFQKHTGINFEYSLIKGRGRYICPLKLASESQSSAASQNTVDMQKAISKGDWSGDLDQWGTAPTKTERQRSVAEKSECLKRSCPSLDTCPYYKANKRADQCTVLVANHALVATDISMGGGQILPSPNESLYIIDEAHALAENSAQHFKRGISVQRQAAWCQEYISHMPKLTLKTQPHALERRSQAIDRLRALATSLEALARYIRQRFGHDDRQALPEDAPLCRFKAGVIPDELGKVLTLVLTATHHADVACGALHDVIEARPFDAVQRFRAGLDSLTYLRETLDLWLKNDSSPVAKWISAGGRDGQQFRLDAVPVRVGPLLKAALWDKCQGAVLTSATLTALGKFDLFTEKLGLGDSGRTRTLQLPAVYNHAQQAGLYLPKSWVDPKDSEAYLAYLVTELTSLLPLYQGSLVLFASRRQMNAVYEKLPAPIRMNILRQGEHPLRELLSIHRDQIDKGNASILFGLASFSEGLDLPGAYCEHVIVTKLPFRSPGCPVLATEHEWISVQDRNPFFEIEVPMVSVKLAQSIGRLLRREDDSGQISILDPRLSRRDYGRALLRGLPAMSSPSSSTPAKVA